MGVIERPEMDDCVAVADVGSGITDELKVRRDGLMSDRLPEVTHGGNDVVALVADPGSNSQLEPDKMNKVSVDKGDLRSPARDVYCGTGHCPLQEVVSSSGEEAAPFDPTHTQPRHHQRGRKEGEVGPLEGAAQAQGQRGERAAQHHKVACDGDHT